MGVQRLSIHHKRRYIPKMVAQPVQGGEAVRISSPQPAYGSEPSRIRERLTASMTLGEDDPAGRNKQIYLALLKSTGERISQMVSFSSKLWPKGFYTALKWDRCRCDCRYAA